MSESTELAGSQAKLQCLICRKEYPPETGLKFCPDDQSLLCLLAGDKFLNTILDEKYEILQLIGTGAFGRVYVGRHIFTDRPVAIKIMTANINKDPVVLNRFTSEARTTNKLVHDNIVSTFDHGLNPQPYIIMEYVEGETLDERIRNQGPLPLDDFFCIFDQVCQAMSVAHAAGCLHRDLKPSNIMIDRATGRAKIVDFGLAKLQGQDWTASGEVMGSPPYMSPEQCRGEDLDERSDIYSVGCVMYEALTGLKAFEGKTAVDTMYRHFNTTPAPIRSLRKEWDFPAALEYVVGRSLADIKDRYKTMEDLRQDLSRAGAGTLRGRLRKFSRPSYRKTVRVLARISAIGNWTIITAAILVYILCLLP